MRIQQQISMQPELREKLIKRAGDEGITLSEYVERLVLQDWEANMEKTFVYDPSVLDEEKVAAIVNLRGILNVPELKNLSDEEIKHLIIEEKYAAYENLNRH